MTHMAWDRERQMLWVGAVSCNVVEYLADVIVAVVGSRHESHLLGGVRVFNDSDHEVTGYRLRRYHNMLRDRESQYICAISRLDYVRLVRPHPQGRAPQSWIR